MNEGRMKGALCAFHQVRHSGGYLRQDRVDTVEGLCCEELLLDDCVEAVNPPRLSTQFLDACG